MPGTQHNMLWAAITVVVVAAAIVVMRPETGTQTDARPEPVTTDLPRPDGQSADPMANVTGVTQVQAEIEAAPPMVVDWHPHWNDARKEAEERNQLVLLYAGLDPRTCPPCRYLETEFFVHPALQPLGKLCVPLHIVADADQATHGPADRALIDQLGIKAYPMLFLLTPEGGVVHRQSAGLYSIYGIDRKIDEAPPEGLLTPPQLLTLIRQRIGAAKVVDRRMAELKKTPGPDAAMELSGLFVEREQYVRALAVAMKAQAAYPSVEMEAQIASLQASAGQRAAAEVAYARLLRDEPDHPQRLEWRLDLALLRLESAGERTDAGPAAEELVAIELAEIAELAAKTEHFDTEARARVSLAEFEKRRENEDALRRQLAWFAEEYLAPPTDHGPLNSTVRLQVAELAVGVGRIEEAVAHLERLQAEFPASEEAQVIKHGFLSLWRSEVARQKAEQDG
ncbi:MAG: hypothetical protein QNJ98_04840 [Planctomycetota bacterium]|nr:hypothetical protein [Planctomycetota bacterium]